MNRSPGRRAAPPPAHTGLPGSEAAAMAHHDPPRPVFLALGLVPAGAAASLTARGETTAAAICQAIAACEERLNVESWDAPARLWYLEQRTGGLGQATVAQGGGWTLPGGDVAGGLSQAAAWLTSAAAGAIRPGGDLVAWLLASEGWTSWELGPSRTRTELRVLTAADRDRRRHQLLRPRGIEPVIFSTTATDRHTI